MTTKARFRPASAIAVAVLACVCIGDSRRTLHATTPDVLSFVFRVGDDAGDADGQFRYPIGLAVGGPLNQIYVTDVEGPAGIGDRLQVFDKDGNWKFTVGGPGSAPGQFTNPTGVAVDVNGKIIVADTDNQRLQFFNADGTPYKADGVTPLIIGSYGNFDPAEYPDPAYIDASGNYIGPPAIGTAGVPDATGQVPVLDRFNYPNRVALRPGTRLMDPTDTTGRVAVTDQANHRIIVFNSMMTPLYAFGGFGTTQENANPLGHLRNPVGLSMDLDRIYVADTDNHRVQIYTQSGTPIRFFGSTAAAAGSDPNADNGPADLSNPNDVQIDDQGHLYVVDTDRSRVLILEEDPATVQTPRCSAFSAASLVGRCAIRASDGTWYDARVVGKDGTLDGEFIYPQSVAVDSLARVVIVDTDKHRFQVFQGARVVISGTGVLPTSVNSGEPVTLNVNLTNDGAVPLDVTVTPTASLSGAFTVSPPAVHLNPGESTASPLAFTFVTDGTGSLFFTVNAKGISSTGAVVRATAVNTTAITVKQAPGPKMSAAISTISATAGMSTATPLTVTITNTGNVALTNLTPLVQSSTPLVTLTAPPPVTADLPAGETRIYAYSFTGAPSSGDYPVTFTATATAGFVGGTGTITSQPPAATALVTIVTDNQPPATTLSVTSGTPGNLGTVDNTTVQWWVTPVQITLHATDTGSGVKAIHYQIEAGGSPPGTASGDTVTFPLSLQGGTNISYWAEDFAGNQENGGIGRSTTVWIDSNRPSISVAGIQPAPNAAGWNNANPTVKFFASEHESGIASSTPDQLITTDGPNQVVTGTAFDKAGNSSSVSTRVHVDRIAPVIACAPTVPSNAAGWYTTQATVTVICSAADQGWLSGLKSVSAVCPTNTGVAPITPAGVPAVGPATASASCTVSAEGVWDVRGEARDVADNVTITTPIKIRIDRTPPTVVCGTASGGEIWPPNHKMVAWNTSVLVTDAVSGTAGFKLTGFSSSEAANAKGDGNTSLDMSGWTIGTPDTSGFVRAERAGVGTGRIYRVYYVGADAAGNTTACTTTLIGVPHDQGK